MTPTEPNETPQLFPLKDESVVAFSQPPTEPDPALQSLPLYQHGITNGLLSLQPQLFESFISQHYEEIDSTQQIASTNKDIEQLTGVYKVARAKRLELLKEVLEKRGEHGSLILRANDVNNNIEFWKKKILRAIVIINDLHARAKSDYSLPAAILFFLFALLFISADYGISLNIVANTLQIGAIGHTDGTTEYTPVAYLFAMAMAGLSVVFKPAYDRLVEKPFHHAANTKRFAIFIVITAVFVFAMLCSLGVMREEILATGLMNPLPDDTSIGVVSETMAAVPGASYQMSGWAKIGIVSSTFLFAIAGAICLGISIPVIHKSYRVMWNNMRQKFWNQRIFKLEQAKLEFEILRVKCEQEIKLVEEKLNDLQEELDAKEIIKLKKESLTALMDDRLRHLIEKSVAIYRDGHERGIQLSGKVAEEWIYDTVLMGSHFSSKEDAKTLPGKQNNSLSRTRPFVALRRIISQQFKNKAGKDSNIHFEYYNVDK